MRARARVRSNEIFKTPRRRQGVALTRLTCVYTHVRTAVYVNRVRAFCVIAIAAADSSAYTAGHCAFDTLRNSWNHRGIILAPSLSLSDANHRTGVYRIYQLISRPAADGEIVHARIQIEASNRHSMKISLVRVERIDTCRVTRS